MLQSAAVQSHRESAGCFWDKRGLLGRFPAFTAVSLLLPSACFDVPLSPCHQTTPLCCLVFACEDLPRVARKPCSKAWGFTASLGQPWELLRPKRPFWDASRISCGLAASPLGLLQSPPESLHLAHATLWPRFHLCEPLVGETRTLLQSLGLYSPSGTDLGASGMGEASLGGS